jgi:hypothetical protein
MDQSTARMTEARSDLERRPADSERRVYDAKTPLHEIEADIARTRVRLSGTIVALERELAPARILEKSRVVLRSALEPAPGPFRQQVWAYAIPLALVLTGLGWLFLLRRRRYQADALSTAGEMPAEAIETGETPSPAPSYADVAGPSEPVSLIDEKTSI